MPARQEGPRNNLQALWAQMTPNAASSSSSATEPPRATSAFQLARPGGSQRPPMSGMKSGELQKVPQSAPTAAVARRAALPAHVSTPTVRPAAGLASPFFTPTGHAGPSSAGSHPTPLAGTGTPSAASPKTYNAKLDALPLDKLQAMLVSNQDEKIMLLEKKSGLDDDEDDCMGEDPEMIDLKLKLLSNRVKELKAAIAARSSMPSSSGSRSNGGTPSHAVRQVPASSEPAPSAPAQSPPAPTEPVPTHAAPTAIYHAPYYLPPPAQPSPAPPPARAPRKSRPLVKDEPKAGPSRVVYVPSSPPPDMNDLDMAEAEEEWSDPPSELSRGAIELVPPTSPMQPETPPPPRRQLTSRRAQAAEGAAVLDGLDAASFEQIFSSPVRSPPRRGPVRVEASTARSNPSGPGPRPLTQASAAPKPPTPRVIKLDVVHPWSKEVEQKLRQVFHLPNFRMNQKDAIDETMAGRDVFVLMPTGGGKSLTYQLPAVCSTGKTKGVTFVVSPLISLINDQTRHLIKRNVPAIAYTGDLTQADKNMAHAELSRPEPYTKVVYVTPEMLTMGGNIKNILRQLIRKNRLARFVIDEAHCVSGWGHDFRSDYLKLGDLRKDYPGVPIMALTATAPNRVQDDILRILGIQGCKVLKQSFNRPNLHYEVRPKLKKVMQDIAGFIGTQEPGASGIIYCSSREKCETIAKELREQHGLGAWHYHAGMSKGDRRKVQEGWQEHKFEVIVATIAFGMGIDKPDVRYVIHHSLPRSLEGYYQETGRAGRDGKHSTCILFYTYGDSKTVFNMIDRDTNLDRNQKERQKDSLREVLRFCTNKTDCRRSQVLAFFNETFDPANCHQGCDVCLGRDQNVLTVRDVTEDAKKVIRMVSEFDHRDQITIINAVDCFRGLAGSSGKGLDNNPSFGVGKDWDRSEAERLVQNLLIERALEEYFTANKAGWSNAYIKVGPESRAFLNGRKNLQMDFRQASPRKAARKITKRSSDAGTGKDRLVPLAQLKKSTAKSTPLSRKRSAQQIAQEEQAFDDSAWPSDDDYEPIEDPDRGRSARSDLDQSTGSATKKLKTSAATKKLTAEQATAQCLEALRKLRDKYTKGDTPALHDDVLQLVALMLPPNKTSLAKVDGVTKAVVETFGTKILGITTKYLKTRAVSGTDAPRPKATLTRKPSNTTCSSAQRSLARTSTSSIPKLNLDVYSYSGSGSGTAEVASNKGGKPVQTTLSDLVDPAKQGFSGLPQKRLALARTNSASGPRF